MQITQIHVTHSRTVSDRSYGNETVRVDYHADVATGDDADAILLDLNTKAREHVWQTLRGSHSEAICRAMETPDERETRDAREQAEYAAAHDRRRAERQAARDLDAAEAHAAVLTAPDDDEEHDEDDDQTPF